MFRHKNKGFTMIELLVVISVIAMLASIVTASMNDARKKSRDSRRIADIRNLLTAFALMQEKQGYLPCHSAFDSSTSSTFLKPYVDQGIIGSSPKDPINSGNHVYNYWTFKKTAGGPCGQVAYIDYTTELPITSCVGGGVLIGNNHCHVFFPEPPNCPNWTDGNLTSCAFRDRPATNSY